eukprot:403345231
MLGVVEGLLDHPLQAVQKLENTKNQTVKLCKSLHSFPNALHMQMSQISQGTLPCITSKHIMSFDLNPMTREIILITESEIAIFDIDQNQFKAVKTFKQLLNYNFQQSPVVQNFGETKISGKETNDKNLKRSSSLSNQGSSKPGTAGQIQQIQKNQNFIKGFSLYLYNYWVVIKNNKQVLFLDSKLQFSKDTISDSNGVVDMLVSQKSEEIITVTKDLRQIRVWTYMIYQKERPMPPIDELPVNVNHVDKLKKSKYSHDQGFFTKHLDNQPRFSYQLKTFQEFIVIMNRRTFDITIWDLGLEKVYRSFSLAQICYGNGIQVGLKKSIVDQIYPGLSNFKTGFLIVDRQQNIYDVSLHSQTVIQKLEHSNIHNSFQNSSLNTHRQNKNKLSSLHYRMSQEDAFQSQLTFTSQIQRRGTINLTAIQVKAMNDVNSGFTPRNNSKDSDIQILNADLYQQTSQQVTKRNTSQPTPMLQLKQQKNSPRNQTLGILNQQQFSNQIPSIINNFLHYLPNQDGSKTLFLLREDEVNGLNFIDIYESTPRCHLHVNFTELLSGNAKQILEIPGLPDKHKPKKEYFQNPLNQKSFYYDIKSRLAVFIDNQGLMCVINTHFRTRKFVHLEDRLKIKDVHIMVNFNDNAPILEQIKQKTFSDEEFLRKDNPYRFMEDYPDFDYLIAVLTFDGILIIVQNEGTQFNEIRVAHRINMQTGVLHSRYIPDKQKLMIIMKEGILKMFETQGKGEFQMVRSCQLMWPDITAIDLRSDEVLICGHESGIIYTQQIKGEIKITEMQLHNYHLTPILQVCLPASGHPNKHFIAWSQNKILTLFSMEEDRPLKVMRFHDNLTKFLYLGNNEIVAFDRNYVFKIDLNDAQCFSDNNQKKNKEEWVSIGQQRILRNQYAKKQLQVEETRNEQFYKFQAYKQNKYKNFNGQGSIEPELVKNYLQIGSSQNLFNSVIQYEFDYLMNPDTSNFKLNQLFYLKELEQFILQDHIHAQIPLKKSIHEIQNEAEVSKKRKRKQTLKSSTQANQFLEQIEFQRKIRQIHKINKQYKSSALNLINPTTSSQLQTKSKTLKLYEGESSISVATSQKRNGSPVQQNISLNSKEQFDSNKNSRSHSPKAKFKIGSMNQDILRVISMKQFETDAQVNHPETIIEDESDTQEISMQNNKGQQSQFKVFLNNVQQQTNTRLIPKLQFGQKFNSQQSTKDQSVFKKQDQNTKNNQKVKDKEVNQKTLNLQTPTQYPLPQISLENYSNDLYKMKNKIRTYEDRAQTAANQQLILRQAQSQSLFTQPSNTTSIQNLNSLGKMQQFRQPENIILGQSMKLNPLELASQILQKPQTQERSHRRIIIKSQSEMILQSDQKTSSTKFESATVESQQNTDQKMQGKDLSQKFYKQSSDRTKDKNTLSHQHKISYSSQLLNEKLKLDPLPITQHTIFPQTSQAKQRSHTSIFAQNIHQRLPMKNENEYYSINQNLYQLSKYGEPQRLGTAGSSLTQQNLASSVKVNYNDADSLGKTLQTLPLKVERSPQRDDRQKIDNKLKELRIKTQQQQNRSRTNQNRRRVIEIHNELVDSEYNTNTLTSVQINPNAKDMTKYFSNSITTTESLKTQNIHRFLQNSNDFGINNQKQAIKPKIHKMNIKTAEESQQEERNKQKKHLKSNQQQQNIKVEDNMISDKQQNQKDYQSALKRILQGDKSAVNNRITITEKKAEIIKQERQQSPDKIDQINKIASDTDSDKSDKDEKDKNEEDDGFLNEEERSLIVDEILRANQMDENNKDGNLVLEDEDSPHRHNQMFLNAVDEEASDGKNSGQRAAINNHFHERKSSRFRVIIQTGKDPKSKTSLSALQQAQQYNILNRRSSIDNVFEDGIFSAHKMQIVKHSKKEKNQQKYMLMKELLRDRVSIQKEEQGFEIIIPKTLKYGKANLHSIEPEEFIKNYNVYKLSFKDILNLIKQQARQDGTAQQSNETVITKDQVSIFLKKNLMKLLKPQDPALVQNSKQIQEKMEKIENVRNRKSHKEKEKMIRLLQKEEELSRKREQAKIDRESNKFALSSTKNQLLEDKRRQISQQHASLYKVITASDDSMSSNERQQYQNTQGSMSGKRSSINLGAGGGGSSTDVQMVFATELKIAERKEEIKRRLELLKMEKDQEKHRVEKLQIFNFIRDRIVRELLINRKMGKYIREREAGMKPEDINIDGDGIQGSFKDDYANAQSRYAQYNKSNGSSTLGVWKDNQNGKSKFASPHNRRVLTHENSQDNHDNDDISPLIYGDPDRFGVNVNKKLNPFRNTINENPQIFIKDDNGQVIVSPRRNSVKQSRQNSDLFLNKVLSSIDVNDHLGNEHERLSLFKQDRSYSPGRNSNLNVGNEKLSNKARNRNMGRSQQHKRRESIEDGEDFSEDEELKIQNKSIYANSKKKRNSEDDIDIDEYYEEDPDSLRPPKSILSKNSSQQYHRITGKPLRISLLNDNNKIKDYNLENSSQQSSNFQLPSQSNQLPIFVAGGGVSVPGDLLSMFDSEQEDYMTKEEEVAKINQELQYQRILEKITEKMMSKKISQFKKELLIRIALNLEMMETADLFTLEDLLERYEQHDQEVKKLIIQLFQEKYQINLGSDLQQLVEDQMNKVKDETKAMRRKNIKELLLKKIRMLNMISRFCKVGAHKQVDQLRNAQNDQKMLKELLDEDDDEFYSDDEDGFLKQEFHETVNEVLRRIFTKDDNQVSKQLENFKKNYRMRFGPQPEYLIKDDPEAEAQNLHDLITAQRLKAFRFNEKNLLLILQEWLHPNKDMIKDTKLHAQKVKRKRKYLYDPNSELNEENLFETFYDLVQEVFSRIKKVQTSIKINEKHINGYSDKNDSDQLGSTNHNRRNWKHSQSSDIFETDQESSQVQSHVGVKKVSEVINLEELNKRRQITQEELEERRYCALRIAEYLENKQLFGYTPQTIKDENGQEIQIDERITGINNFLNPQLTDDKRITRGSIQHVRQNEGNTSGQLGDRYKDPFIEIMVGAVRKFAELLQNDP